MDKNILHELLVKRPDVAQWHRDFSQYLQRVTTDLNTMTEEEIKAKYPKYSHDYNPNYVAIKIS